MRAMCGMISPTQPMMPLIATTAAVIRRGRDDEHEAQASGVDAERLGLLVAERHQVHAPAQKVQRHQAEQNERHGPQDIGRRRRGEAAEQPEGDRRQLVVGIGQHLEQRDERAGERASTTPASTSTRTGSRPRTADATR